MGYILKIPHPLRLQRLKCGNRRVGWSRRLGGITVGVGGRGCDFPLQVDDIKGIAIDGGRGRGRCEGGRGREGHLRWFNKHFSA
eukprot:767072-Hanusia_phi.AAC.8